MPATSCDHPIETPLRRAALKIGTTTATKTVLRWHRDPMRRRHGATSRPKRSGRPPTRRSIQVLVLRLARENSSWGYRRMGVASPIAHRGGRYRPAVSRILSGVPLSKITASGRCGNFAPAATDGRQSLAGHVFPQTLFTQGPRQPHRARAAHVQPGDQRDREEARGRRQGEIRQRPEGHQPLPAGWPEHRHEERQGAPPRPARGGRLGEKSALPDRRYNPPEHRLSDQHPARFLPPATWTDTRVAGGRSRVYPTHRGHGENPRVVRGSATSFERSAPLR